MCGLFVLFSDKAKAICIAQSDFCTNAPASVSPCWDSSMSSFDNVYFDESGFCLFVADRVSLCSPGCPGTHSINQAGLELTEIHLPLPPGCWD